MALTGAAGTLLGPLTTTWSMPESCSVHLMRCSTCSEAWRGQACVSSDGEGQAKDDTGCWPPAEERAGTPTPAFKGWGFYSPGLACPSDYRTACTARYGEREEWEIQFDLRPEETAVGCCPEDFECANVNGNTCTRTATAGPEFTILTGECSNTDISSGPATFPQLVVTTTTVNGIRSEPPEEMTLSTTREMTLFAPMFQLNFKESDVASFSASLASSTSSEAAASPSGEEGSDGADDSGGMSNGARIGVAVGLVLLGICVVALIVWLVLRRRRRGRKAREEEEAAAAGLERQQVHDKSWPAVNLIHEMDSPARPSELHGRNENAPEGQGQSEPVELSSTRT